VATRKRRLPKSPARKTGSPGPEQAQIPAEHSKGSLDPTNGKPFPIVGVGASAGGLEAIRQLLAHLPDDTGMAFVLVQHLDPRHESRLADLLAKTTRMPVSNASHGVPVRANHVYVIPPNADIAIAGGVLHVSPREETHRPHLPIDYLFRTLAEDQQARAIGVVLSGTGSDGTLGLCEIKAVGGITFAQEERSAKHTGMPHSAIDSGCVDFVMTPEEIAGRLAKLGSHPYLAEKELVQAIEDDEERLYKRILAAVRSVTRVDFSQYRDTTIKRRIMRRMALHTQYSLADYAERLEADGSEVDALYHDLLINVTSFFRDPDLFEALKRRVFPEIVKEKSPTAPLRMWVPGCSTGQEAYSLAITLLEFLDDFPVRPPIQIFATDLSDPTSLDKARAGVYPETIEADVSPDRLHRFFKREDHLYRIDKSIRDMCVFARQNVTSDPPFSHLDLISCRNVLIYLATPLQKRVLPAFHYALNAPGFLVLGTAETVGENADLFELLDRSNKIYAKKATASRPPLYFPNVDFKSIAAAATRLPGAPPPAPADFGREADRILLGRFAPPGVLINENLDIIQFRGRTSAFLESPAGEPTTNLLKMAREGLFLELRSAIAEAIKQERPTRRDGVRVRVDGSIRDVNLEVVPVTPPGGRAPCLLVLFHDPAPAPASSGLPNETLDDREEFQLRRELAATKEYLQSLVAQQDASNEELRSANEEILSSNEELQSTNEELETAKEELQSTNEELTTVNEQLQSRNVELSQAYSDLTNLLSSIKIPVVMVGGDLRIRRFTPPAAKSMNLLPSDVNRPIGDIRPASIVPDLEDVIAKVIETEQPVEREIRDREDRWHALRVFPYRTAEDNIDGAVIVLVDIDQHKRAELMLRDADRRKDEFIAMLAHELRNPLGPMQNAIEIMDLAQDKPETLGRVHEVLERQIRHLARIVGDLVDISRIRERKIELQRQPIEVAALVENAIEICRAFVESRRHQLTVTLPSEPLYLDADPIRLSQVLINLINNAAKFSQPGQPISITAEKGVERTLPGNGASAASELILRVRDNGQGIPADLLPRVFDMFTQGSGSVEDRQGGSAGVGGLGVGLALARSLVLLHDGSIEALSAGPGRGSEFIIRLPLADEELSVPAGAGPESAMVSSDPKRVLVVDDNRDHAESLGMLLELMGHQVRIANDGPAALLAAADFRPDVALVDIGLPGLNGYEVARALRAADERNRDLVLVAQTGWNEAEDHRRSREAGFDHHLVKPVRPEDLRVVLESRRPPA
jgi:two-component system CheB/CheR fusion protein